ncbi:hypothetical protein BZL30_2135 [Mycobacterium kansasii]|uniref:Uncharacterized protein n=1 Tax=Mycobacterium kansasii TaxID=1768 RepID=A0A1V3XIA9_MYCKA|nr:hypothetical protein BZL30_2135 [Mycobacterium kansasii]
MIVLIANVDIGAPAPGCRGNYLRLASQHPRLSTTRSDP